MQAKISPGTHPNGQLRGDVTRPSSRVLGVEVGLGVAQEGRFEDVSTATIGKEAALVQVHLLPWSLEVQGHCRAAQGKWSLAAGLHSAQRSASVMPSRRNHVAILSPSNCRCWNISSGRVCVCVSVCVF